MEQPNPEPDHRALAAYVRDCIASAYALEVEAHLLRQEAKLYRKVAKALAANAVRRVML